MKRFFSWVTLYLTFVVENLAVLVVAFASDWLIGELVDVNAILRWIIIIFAGSTILGIIFGVSFYGALFSCKLSQLVWKSQKGLRYCVMGGFFFVYYIYLTVTSFINGSGFIRILVNILLLVYFGLVVFLGKAMAKDDGAPPTKKEILQAKLEKLESKGK